MQRDLHPTVLSSLEGIVDQMVWFRENWYEEVLRQLRHSQVLRRRGGGGDEEVGGLTLGTPTMFGQILGCQAVDCSVAQLSN